VAAIRIRALGDGLGDGTRLVEALAIADRAYALQLSGAVRDIARCSGAPRYISGCSIWHLAYISWLFPALVKL